MNYEDGSDFLYHNNDNSTKMTTVLGEPKLASAVLHVLAGFVLFILSNYMVHVCSYVL